MLVEIGRLTQEVTAKTVMAGGEEKSVCNNRLAITYDKDKTAFIDIAAWKHTADFMAEHFQKGDELYVEGEIRSKTNRLEGKDISIPYLLVTKVKFTHGNKRE